MLLDRKRIRSFGRNERGAVAIIFGMTLVPVVVLAGAGVDFGRSVQARTQLQRAVDFAALGAAQMSDATQQQKIDRATNFFWANDAANPFGVLGVPVLNVVYVGDDLTVNSRALVNTPFLSIAGVHNLEVKATATVGATTQSTAGQTERACILVMDPTSDKAIKMRRDGSINANCGIHVNSSNNSALSSLGDATVNASYTCVKGNYSAAAGDHYNPLPTAGCPVMQNPFNTLVAPSNAGAACVNPSNNTTRYTPGVYCSIQVTNKNVTFDPGVYVIKGQFNLTSSATAKITPGMENSGIGGVMFYLAGNNSTFKITSSAKIKLTAPKSGPYMGILMWNPTANAADHDYGGHSESELEGAIVSPLTGVQFHSQSGCHSSEAAGATANWTVWVVKHMEVQAGSSLVVNANFTNSGAVPKPTVLAQGGMMYEVRAGKSRVIGSRLKK